MKKLLMTAGAAVLAMGTTVSAATLDIVGGTAGEIPGGGKNEVLNALFTPGTVHNPLQGFYGSTIELSHKSGILVEIVGWEAGLRNVFDFGGTSFTADDRNSLPTSLNSSEAKWTVAGVSAGVLDFQFEARKIAGGLAPVIDPIVENGETNENNPGEANFFATKDHEGVLWLFFDDGVVVDDDNHDDLVVRLSAVPLPAGALLLLTGMGALALRRRAA